MQKVGPWESLTGRKCAWPSEICWGWVPVATLASLPLLLDTCLHSLLSQSAPAALQHGQFVFVGPRQLPQFAVWHAQPHSKRLQRPGAWLQGKGLGKFLMQLLELIARRSGVARVMLTVFHGNAAARALYQRLGYALDKDSPISVDPASTAT